MRNTVAAPQVETTEPWSVIVIDTSKRGVFVEGERVLLDPVSGERRRQLHLGETFSLGLRDDGAPSFAVGLIAHAPTSLGPGAAEGLSADVPAPLPSAEVSTAPAVEAAAPAEATPEVETTPMTATAGGSV